MDLQHTTTGLKGDVLMEKIMMTIGLIRLIVLSFAKALRKNST